MFDIQILAIQSSPNEDGLTSRLAQAALEGARKEGADTELVHLCALSLLPCRACGQGWGHHHDPNPTLPADACIHPDGFADLRRKILAADGLIFSTPVYFGDLSESAKVFLDRLRRCEWPKRERSGLRGKHAVAIAAAGGSGNGALEAATILERYLVGWFGMTRVASLAVTRFNQGFLIESAREAGSLLARMAEGPQ